MIEEKPRMLSEALWAYRTSKRKAVTTPFAPTFGHDAMLPMEITRTGNLSYDKAMFAGLEYLDEVRMDAMRSSIFGLKRER